MSTYGDVKTKLIAYLEENLNGKVNSTSNYYNHIINI
ncbi:putative ORFan [Tupanvirus deep ocean]|uniref:ORFan n=2 Tax=Tupanvirus TaxID=2094720 RepID=A0AC62A7B6_9VIRU|nr:putative ORFan [Tupanvirus deep ocean]QKU33583.1 putative ORFan [Tupanvirus deep ocean]